MNRAFIIQIAAALMASFLNACGGKGGGEEAEPGRGPILSAFYAASAESGVPVRMMMATAFIESGLQAERQSVVYPVERNSATSAIAFSDSAFGISMKELGLANDVAAGSSLPLQISAYGRLLKERVANSGLPANAVTAEEKVRWIWRLAEVHRGSDIQSRNLWAVFGKEMLNVLNNGYEVRDVRSDEIVKLEKESVPIKEEQLPSNYRQDLTLDTYSADIPSAYLFSLHTSQASDIPNRPTRIEVIHCPLSLSACLNLQTKDSTNYVALGAHYVIPNIAATSPGILQMARHDESIELARPDGSTEIVSDRIVIMLAGYSGRYIQGVRSYASPMWLNDYQLRLFGAAVNDVCASLARRNGVNFDACVSPSGANGIVYREQPAGTYRWGDISEFDEGIFYPYVKSREGILAATAMELEGSNQIEAGARFKLNTLFQGSARRVEIERLVRCGGEGQRVVWEPVHTQPVRNVTSYSFETSWYDAGPNGNGEQFFRAKVTGDGSKFLGWAVKQVQLLNFTKDSQVEGSARYCSRP